MCVVQLVSLRCVLRRCRLLFIAMMTFTEKLRREWNKPSISSSFPYDFLQNNDTCPILLRTTTQNLGSMSNFLKYLLLLVLLLFVASASSLAQYKPSNQQKKAVRKTKPYVRHISANKQARRYYEILDTYQAGISLAGSEVKSARLGTVSLQSSYIKVTGSSCFLVNSRFSEYANAFNGGHEVSLISLRHCSLT